MSKNFELLQEIGGDEDLFRTIDSTLDGLASEEDKAASNETERDRFLRGASLPNPLANAEKPDSKWTPEAVEFRSPTSVTTPIGMADLSVFRVRHEIEEAVRPTIPLAENSALPTAPAPEKAEASPDTEAATYEKIDWGQVDWAETLKALVTGRKTRRRTLRGSDLNVIAREEELKLVQRIFPGAGHNVPQVVLFSRLDEDDESTAICARAAEILASRGDGPVCVVDANFHSPSLHRYFCTENLKGLAESALETAGIENFVQQIGESNLWLMPGGRAISQLTFSAIAEGLRKRVTELRYAFKYVIIQAGALRLETSEMLLSRWTDGVVLVVEANSTPRELAKRVKENLETARVKFLGVVLNNRTFPVPESLYRSF